MVALMILAVVMAVVVAITPMNIAGVGSSAKYEFKSHGSRALLLDKATGDLWRIDGTKKIPVTLQR